MNVSVGKLIGLAVFGLVAIGVFFSGWYTVDEGFRGVITRNGAVILEALQIENVDFSDTYESAVEAAAKAEAEVKTARQELEKARVETQKKVAVAEAEAQATKLRADAEAYQTRAQGLAEAEAIKARAEALNSNPALVNLTAVEKWNGSLPSTMVPGASVPFIGVK